MSFLLRTTSTARMVARSASTIPFTRSFTASSHRTLKESDSNTNDQASKYEHHKQDQLQKQKDGKNHWKPELASDSEEAIAADRHEHNDHSAKGIKELQEKTAKKAEENAK